MIDNPPATVTLPTVLSDLLALALRDAEAIHNTPGYHLDMSEWTRTPDDPESQNECTACLAGAVILQTLGEPLLEEPSYKALGYGGHLDTLCILDDLRRGWLPATTIRGVTRDEFKSLFWSMGEDLENGDFSTGHAAVEWLQARGL